MTLKFKLINLMLLIIIAISFLIINPIYAYQSFSNITVSRGLIASQYKINPVLAQQFVGRGLNVPPGFVPSYTQFTPVIGSTYYMSFADYTPSHILIINASWITLMKLILIILVASLDWVFSTPFGLWRPLVAGTLTGLILGDPLTGLIVGSFLEFIYLGYASICGLAFPEPSTGTVIAVLVVSALGLSAGSSIVFAMAASLLAMSLEYASKTFNVVFEHWADLAINKGQFNLIPLINTLGAIPLLLSRVIPVLLLSIVVLTNVKEFSMVQGILQDIKIGRYSIDLSTALETMGIAMIAFGIALMFNSISSKLNSMLLILGAALTIILKSNILIIIPVALVIALLINARRLLSNRAGNSINLVGARKRSLPRSDLLKGFFLSWFIQTSMNYERFQGLGFLHNILFIERKLRGSVEELKKWLMMHNDFYYTIPQLHNLIYGIVVSLEEDGVGLDTVRYIKASLMIPILVIGQSAITYVLMPTIFIAGAVLGLHGFIYAPLIAVLAWTSSTWLLKYYLTIVGYRYGSELSKLINSGLINAMNSILSNFASIILGAIAAAYVTIVTPLQLINTIPIMPLILIGFSYILLKLIKFKNTAYGYLVSMVIFLITILLLSIIGVLSSPS